MGFQGHQLCLFLFSMWPFWRHSVFLGCTLSLWINYWGWGADLSCRGPVRGQALTHSSGNNSDKGIWQRSAGVVSQKPSCFCWEKRHSLDTSHSQQVLMDRKKRSNNPSELLQLYYSGDSLNVVSLLLSHDHLRLYLSMVKQRNEYLDHGLDS